MYLKVALKRQQAVEDAIALRLAYNETGAAMEALPPGKIFGMNVTEPCVSPLPNSASSASSAGSTMSSPEKTDKPVMHQGKIEILNIQYSCLKYSRTYNENHQYCSLNSVIVDCVKCI